MKTVTIGIECVGRHSRFEIEFGNCLVKSIEVEIDHVSKIIQANEYGPMPLVEVTRKDKINYCKFEVFDDAFGYYTRKIQTRPAKKEHKLFRVQNGQLSILGDFKDLGSNYFYGLMESYYSHYCSIYRKQARSSGWYSTKYKDWYKSVKQVK